MAKFSQFQSESQKQNTNSQKRENIDDNIMSRFDEYKDMSQTELSQKLFEEVSRQKSEGSFDYSALENMLEAIRGNLSEADYQNVKRMLELLRRKIKK